MELLPLVVLCELRDNNSTDLCPMETLPTVNQPPIEKVVERVDVFQVNGL